MMENTKMLEKHIVGKNGIGYTFGEDGLYYPDLELPEGTNYNIGKYGITEELKENDQMKWVGLMNNVRSAAEEIIVQELIYV